MFKRFLALLGVIVIVFTNSSIIVSAADTQTDFVTSINLTSGGFNVDKFDPRKNALNIGVNFNSAELANLNQSEGSVKIISGTKVIKTVYSWTSGNFAGASSLNWDGKSNDGTPDALGFCPASQTYCNDGDYSVQVNVKSPINASDNYVETETKAFSIFTTPDVDITGVSASPASFNPSQQQTTDITFTSSAAGFITVQILDGTAIVKTLINDKQLSAGTYNKSVDAALEWNGKNVNNQIVTAKEYTVKVFSRKTAGGAEVDSETTKVTVLSATSAFQLLSYSSAASSFDPSPLGQDETMDITYNLSQQADSVILEFKDKYGNVIDQHTSVNITSETYSWDGISANKLVKPGTYTVSLSAVKSGSPTINQDISVSVQYLSANKPELTSYTILPEEFDPDEESTEISFNNTSTGYITVEILNGSGSIAATFSDYDNDFFSTTANRKITWWGTDNFNNDLSTGSYLAVATIRNDYGVSTYEKTVKIANTTSNIPSENAHIKDISFNPSSTFEPAKDDELVIKFDIEKDLSYLKVEAIRGEIIEIYDDESLDEEDNFEITWEGTDDDDEYVEEGSWKIRFTSIAEGESAELKAEKNIKIEYEKPEIDDLYLSKDEFDNDMDESTYIMFRVDSDALIDINILLDNKEDDNFIEDMEVEEDLWYAVEWDGNGYDYDDDIDIQVIAKNIVNEDIESNPETESVDIREEDDSSSRKANITNDYISPVITEGDENMTFFFDLEDDADISITIRKGTSSSGSKVIDLLDDEEFFSGEHEIVWDGKNDNGNSLSKGIYNYKITSYLSSSDNEEGIFIVGDLGEIDGEATGGGVKSNDDDDDGKISSNIISINGGADGSSDNGSGSQFDDECAGFWDVTENNIYCDAIKWAKSEGIFQGYADGSFKPYQAINRVETLKVILEATNTQFLSGAPPNTNLGFSDVIIGEWYMLYIYNGQQLGIFQGDAGKSTARPEATVNRAELIKMIFETLNAAYGYSTGACTDVFNDVNAGVWFYDYACEAKELDIFDGNFLNAANLSTRGEVAEALYRLDQVNAL